MYRNVMIAVDNSDCSNLAIDLTVELAKSTCAHVTGVHVYAARLHDRRFRDLEPGLPDRYQQEKSLQEQRDIHENLIGRGLRIISDFYLDVFERKCQGVGISVERKALEGRNYEELLKDTRASAYDLVVIGAHGLGRVERSVLGSVCERVARLVESDIVAVRTARSWRDGPLMVAIDGSAHALAALAVALQLSALFGNEILAVAAYDPFFHRVAFKGMAEVLSAEAATLFRFREQEQLHDTIIDDGLAQVYRSHLLRAEKIADEAGIALKTAVLEGKPFDAIARKAEQVRPALLLVGRVGIHHGEGVALGSTAENLLRCADCNLLIVNRNPGQAASDDLIAEEPTAQQVCWSAQAEDRLGHVPWFVRKMARKRIEDFAVKNGRLEVTLDVYERARRHFGMGAGRPLT